MQATIPLHSADEAQAVLGINDRNARLFGSEFHVAVTVRNGGLVLEGEERDVEAAQKVVAELIQRFRTGGHLDEREVEMLLRAGGARPQATVLAADVIVKNRNHRSVVPRTDGQRRYVDAMRAAEVVFAIGPAGTGKTYLAVAMAVRSLREGQVKKLILTRPAVEAGEKLGFLPGSVRSQGQPLPAAALRRALRPVDPAQIRKFQENDVIDVAPLAYMRGRTLSSTRSSSWTRRRTRRPAQMKMFLTRMGEGSRMVVTGDVTQIDLPNAAELGARARRRASSIASKASSICQFDKQRHRAPPRRAAHRRRVREGAAQN